MRVCGQQTGMNDRRRRHVAGFLVALCLLLLVAVALLGTPGVESVSSEWGAVSTETSEVRVTVSVHNPYPVAIPRVVDIGYVARLNDVVVAEGREEGVGLAPGRNTLRLSIPVRNDRIDDWWVTHVERNERSTMTIDARVEGPLGYSSPVPVQSQRIETAFLASLSTAEAVEVEVAGEPFVVIADQRAEWGEATAEATPVGFTANLTNEHDAPIRFDGLGYVVRTNDVVLGQGTQLEPVNVSPGETGTLSVAATLETQRMPAWWVTHLRQGERTNLSVVVFGVVDPAGGVPVEVPLLERTAVIETDLLGTGESTFEPGVDAAPALDVTQPTVGETTLRWGAVTDETTAVEATVAFTNPNADSALADLLALDLTHDVAINDVPVASGATHVDRLPTGEGTLTVVAELENSRVPEWWARHLNRGEHSTVRFDTGGRVDAGMTTFAVETPAEERQFSTNLLADLNSDQPGGVTLQGRRVLEVRSTRASWGRATPDAAPIRTSVRVRNDGPVAVTVRDLSYRVVLNGVVLADRDAPGSWTVAPGTTGRVDPTLVLDNARMAEWWPTHVRNGETSRLTVEVRATVEADGRSGRVTIDALGADYTVRTDVLAGG